MVIHFPIRAFSDITVTQPIRWQGMKCRWRTMEIKLLWYLVSMVTIVIIKTVAGCF